MNVFLKMYLSVQSLMAGEEGQDLVEYALLVALVALACVTGINCDDQYFTFDLLYTESAQELNSNQYRMRGAFT